MNAECGMRNAEWGMRSAGEKKLALLAAAADAVGVDLGEVLRALRLEADRVPSHVADDLIECLAGLPINREVM